MRTYIFYILLWCIGQIGKSQNHVYFRGEVRDSLGSPLQYANVLALDTTTKKLAGFAVTNENGQFRLRLVAGINYQLKISFIGYAPYEQNLLIETENETPFLFILNADIQRLGEVEIVAELPVTFKGDTIIYKAEAFTQGNERKLEDVLEDLPGFQIDDNGEIKVQGKKVDKVLIDGKEFFDGDTKLATKNIPANVVDKVQLLQNYNDIGPLRNVSSSEQLAINIELKEDGKRMTFGDIKIGAGPAKRYFGHSNTFYYAEKTNLNLILDGNNIGELAFTMNDYFRFSGGLGSLTSDRGSTFELSSDQLGIPLAERNNAKALDNQLGAFNFNLKPAYGFQIGGFAIGSFVDDSFGSLSSRRYLLDTAIFDEYFESNSFLNNQSGLGKISLKYAPNFNLYLDYQLFVRSAAIKNGDQQLSDTQTFTNRISSTQTQTPWAVEQKVSTFYSLTEKDVFSVEINHKLTHQDPNFYLTTTLPPFEGIIPLQNSELYRLHQFRDIITKNIEFLSNYYHIINRTNHINFSIGQNLRHQQYDAKLLQDLDTMQITLNQETFENNAAFTFRDTFVGLIFKNKWGKLTCVPELTLHYFSVKHNQVKFTEGFTQWRILPSFKAKYEIRTSQSINLNYSLKANFMDIQKVVANVVLNNYNTLLQGNPALTNSWFHSLNLNYTNFNMYSLYTIYGGLTLQRKIDDIQNSFEVNQWERISIPKNIFIPNETATAYLHIEKRFQFFKAALDGSWNYSRIHNQLESTYNTNTNNQNLCKASFDTQLSKSINFQLAQEIMINKYKGNEAENTFVNHESNIRLNWYVIENLNWITNYSYNLYNNLDSRSKSKYSLLDMNIFYRKDSSPWEFGLKGMNLLNTTSIRRDSFTDNIISTYSYGIQKRYTLFSIMYDL